MSDDAPTAPVEHDNSWTRPYLATIANAGPDGLSKAESDEIFEGVHKIFNPEGEWIGASKVRQTLYIARLARGVGSFIVLTDAGRAYLEQADG